MNLSKFKGIIANIAAAISLFIPIFTIEALDSALSTTSAWGLNSYELDGSLAPVNFISFFDSWVEMFKDLNINTFTISAPFTLFIILEIAAAIFFVKSITHLNYNVHESQEYSKKSIIAILVINIIGIFSVLIYNGTISSAASRENAFSNYLVELLSMEFPVWALIFICLCIAGIVWINRDDVPYTGTYTYSNAGNTPIGWKCYKCGTENSNHSTNCSNCDTKRVMTSVGGENEGNRWICSCGRENSRLLSECAGCGKPRESTQKPIIATAQEALGNTANKIKDAISSAPNSFANSTANFDKIKQLKELLDMGAITQDEFDAKKKEILKL